MQKCDRKKNILRLHLKRAVFPGIFFLKNLEFLKIDCNISANKCKTKKIRKTNSGARLELDLEVPTSIFGKSILFLT